MLNLIIFLAGIMLIISGILVYAIWYRRHPQVKHAEMPLSLWAFCLIAAFVGAFIVLDSTATHLPNKDGLEVRIYNLDGSLERVDGRGTAKAPWQSYSYCYAVAAPDQGRIVVAPDGTKFQVLPAIGNSGQAWDVYFEGVDFPTRVLLSLRTRVLPQAMAWGRSFVLFLF